MITIKSKIHLSPLRCDMITLTLHLKPDEQKWASEAVERLIDADYAKPRNVGGYSRSISIAPADDLHNLLKVQVRPKNPTHAFLRVEFNPATCTPYEVRPYLDLMIPNGGYKRLFTKGICTRLDVAVDVHGINMERLVITKPGARVSRPYLKDGQMQSLYWGSEKSDEELLIYDKAAQLKKKANAKKSMPVKKHVRLEARLTRRFPVNTLHQVKNLFIGIGAVVFPKLIPQPEDDELFRLFLASCQTRGVHYSSQLLDKSREAMLKRFDSAQADWWNPVKLWKGWAKVVTSLTNPPHNTLNLASLMDGCGK